MQNFRLDSLSTIAEWIGRISRFFIPIPSEQA